MRKIFHPNVVLFLGVATGTDGQIIIVSELMRGDLDHTIYDQHRDVISIERKLRMIRDAALGINWLHGICNIIHRSVVFNPLSPIRTFHSKFLSLNVVI